MRKCLTVINIMEKVIKMTDDIEVKRAAGQVIKNNKLEALREVVGEKFLKDGPTPEVMELNRELDVLVNKQQSRFKKAI